MRHFSDARPSTSASNAVAAPTSFDAPAASDLRLYLGGVVILVALVLRLFG